MFAYGKYRSYFVSGLDVEGAISFELNVLIHESMPNKMKIKEYRSQFIQELTPIYDAGEAESFFYLILEEKNQMKRIDLALRPDLEFSKEELLVWNSILEQRLARREPAKRRVFLDWHWCGL